jgi:hypothetical protein
MHTVTLSGLCQNDANIMHTLFAYAKLCKHYAEFLCCLYDHVKIMKTLCTYYAKIMQTLFGPCKNHAKIMHALFDLCEINVKLCRVSFFAYFSSLLMGWFSPTATRSVKN